MDKIAYRILIRVRKEDSAFVYAVLEASEGVASFSTLDPPADTPHSPYRDLELYVPHGMMEEARFTLQSLGDLIYEHPPTV